MSIILLGGCVVNSNSDDFDDETIRKAKEIAENYLRSNYKDIKTIEFEDGDYSTPMGGLIISGIVNGNEKANFSIDMGVESFEIGGIGTGEEFPEMKEECKDEDCDY